MISDKEIDLRLSAWRNRRPRRSTPKGGRPASLDGYSETAAMITMRWLVEVIGMTAREAAGITAPHFVQCSSKTNEYIPIPEGTLRKYYSTFRKSIECKGDTHVWTQDEFRPWRDRVPPEVLAKYGNQEDRSTLTKWDDGRWVRVFTLTATVTLSAAGAIKPAG